MHVEQTQKAWSKIISYIWIFDSIVFTDLVRFVQHKNN